MREILFRGKRVNNEEWVEGTYYPVKYTGFSIPGGTDYYILTYPSGGGKIQAQVIPETIGQYTGLTDKNGVKIFEGDIVKEYKTKDKVKGVVKFGEYQSGINKYADDLGFYVEWTTENFLIRELGYWCRKNMLEIISNIHDNPELLEEK